MNVHAEQMDGVQTCGHCQTANMAGGKFCKGCGKPLAASFVPPGGKPPGFNSVIPPMTMAGGAPVSFAVPLDATNAFNVLAAAVQSSGGQMVGQSPPHALFFQMPYKNMLVSFSKLIFDGQASVQPGGPNVSQISLALKIKSSSLGTLAGLYVASLVILLVMQMPVLIVMIAAVAGGGYAFWTTNTQAPNALRAQIHAAIMMQSGAANASGAQVPPVQPATPPPGATQTPSAEGPIEQITRLAELRKLGAISDAEFEAKKTELLARL